MASVSDTPNTDVDNADPYATDASQVREAPTSFLESLSYIGPGFILSASIVGSGELVATTLAGAKAGFVLMWFIIFSCLVKVAVQLEFGKIAITSSESTMASLNALPGPHIGKANWSIWTWLTLMLAKLLQVGGIVGGVVLAILQLMPIENRLIEMFLAYGVAASVSLLVAGGRYKLIERACLIMIGGFTLFTLASLASLQVTDLAIEGNDLLSGLIPNVPADTAILVVAIGAFGITGVGGDEIMAYNYWLIEKGYARYVGVRDGSAAWDRRAKGWIRIMHYDALASMIAYTAMTVMFYLLGAAVLHRQGLVPEESNLISVLSKLYTETLGSWANIVFLLGAIVVLYSTLLAALAAWTRMFGDAFARLGIYEFGNQQLRNRWFAILAWTIPAIWASLYLFFKKPAAMIIVGGLATVGILLIVVFAALFFRYKRAIPALKPSRFYDMALWVSAIAIVLVASYLAVEKVAKPLVEFSRTTPTDAPSEKPSADDSERKEQLG